MPDPVQQPYKEVLKAVSISTMGVDFTTSTAYPIFNPGASTSGYIYDYASRETGVAIKQEERASIEYVYAKAVWASDDLIERGMYGQTFMNAASNIFSVEFYNSDPWNVNLCNVMAVCSVKPLNYAWFVVLNSDPINPWVVV